MMTGYTERFHGFIKALSRRRWLLLSWAVCLICAWIAYIEKFPIPKALLIALGVGMLLLAVFAAFLVYCDQCELKEEIEKTNAELLSANGFLVTDLHSVRKSTSQLHKMYEASASEVNRLKDELSRANSVHVMNHG